MRPGTVRGIIALPMLSAVLVSLVVAQGPSLSTGRAVVKALTSNETASVWAQSAPGLKAQFGSLENFTQFVNRVSWDFGKELRVISEGLQPRGELTVYKRVAHITNYARGMEWELAFDDSGRLASLAAKMASAAAPTTTGRYRQKARLRLPIDSGWYVLWGGRSYQDNKHAAVPDQRYALDLFIVKGNNSFQDDGTKNEQYFCWGQPARAASDGVVVVAQDGAPDNEPNKPRAGNIYGNYVVIDHGNSEYSLVAHLQKGSLKVKVGERVASGQQIGSTGNSGMSTEPHVHYQLMDKADWVEANGLPAQFSDYMLDGQLITRGEPKRGEIISHANLEARRETR